MCLSAKKVGSRSGLTFVRPDVGQMILVKNSEYDQEIPQSGTADCLQKLSADNTRRQRVKTVCLCSDKKVKNNIRILTIYIWASSRENLSSVLCEQQRHRPACASAQSDQRLCYSLIGKYHIYTCHQRKS